MWYHAEFGVSALKGVATDGRNHPKLESAGAPPLWDEGVKFGSSASKGVCITKREPQKLGNAGASPPCRTRIDLPPTTSY